MGAAFLSRPLAASKVGLSALVLSYLLGYIPVCCSHDGTASFVFANCWLLLDVILTLTPTRKYLVTSQELPSTSRHSSPAMEKVLS